MSEDATRRFRFLVLGGGEGWHSNQLHRAAAVAGCEMQFATYESLAAKIGSAANDRGVLSSHPLEVRSEAGNLADFDAILTRTMPAGTLEQVTFRLATLHNIDRSITRPVLINPPRSLEIAIDKFATLAHVAELGYRIPETRVVQTRREAMDAFRELGSDCVVKPIFGGEGRGVMRIQDQELAWYTFWTLEQLGAVSYVQQFIRPGGSDTRLLLIGDSAIAVRRQNPNDFRTNVTGGAACLAIEPEQRQVEMAKQICCSMGLKFASVDVLDCDDGQPRVVEVNGIPGWKGAQRVTPINIADQIVRLLCQEASARSEVTV